MSASSSDPLEQEHQRLREDARQQRREFVGSVDGKFARIMDDAVRQYLEMKGQGVSKEDRLKGLELVVREHWPRGRSREWKYLCDDCRDTGWRYDRCRGFHRCKPEHDDLQSEREHDYVTPCGCPKGDRFKRQAHTMDSDAELTKVGRTKRRTTSWSRPGR